MTLFPGISAFGDSTSPMFRTQNKTLETERLAEKSLFLGYDYVMRLAERTFIIEVLFIGWLRTQFIPKTH
jgi:hypothetical protein